MDADDQTKIDRDLANLRKALDYDQIFQNETLFGIKNMTDHINTE